MAGGRFDQKDVLPYIVAQVAGAIVAAFVLYWIAKGPPDWELAPGKLASNGYDAASPDKYGMGQAFVTEVIMTAMFLMVIMGSTHGRAAAGAAPIAIGMALMLIHLISIPVTNTSVNPARSAGRRRRGARTVVAVLGRSTDRRCAWRDRLSHPAGQ